MQLGLAPVHCDTWAGFIFVNLDREPRWQRLREYLGADGRRARRTIPFDRMTERYSFRAENESNWKVFIDAFQEYYHVPPLHTHQLGPTPEAQNPEYEFEGRALPDRRAAPHGEHQRDLQAPVAEPSTCIPPRPSRAAAARAPWDAPDLGATLPGANPVRHFDRWGIDNFQVFPNLEILIYERNWFITYRYWPARRTTRTCTRATSTSFPPPAARERLAHEYAALTFKEYGLQDAGTLDGTQMGLEQGAFDSFPLNDQEILVRHFHKTVGDWVAEHARSRGET